MHNQPIYLLITDKYLSLCDYSNTKEKTQEVREGPTYMSNICGIDADLTLIPPPCPQPGPLGFDTASTEYVFFDLETTGLGELFVNLSYALELVKRN